MKTKINQRGKGRYKNIIRQKSTREVKDDIIIDTIKVYSTLSTPMLAWTWTWNIHNSWKNIFLWSTWNIIVLVHLEQGCQTRSIPNIYSYLVQKYPEVKKFAVEIMCYFGSTYLCEQFFSCMKINKTIHRSRLTDENLTAIMKVKCAQSLFTNLEKLSTGKRFQVSGKKLQ